MKRLKPGPFGGIFDEIDYDTPIFLPILLTCVLLVLVWIAAAWAILRRRRRRHAPNSGRGFEVSRRPPDRPRA